MNKAIVCAHRGLDDSAPENTLASFEGALARGMVIECDIQRTADDHLAIVHDPTVDRTTDGSGEIAQMTLAEVKEVDAGSWYGEPFAGQRVPTFDEALAVVNAQRLVSAGTTGMIRDCLERHGLIEEVVCIGAGLSSVEVRREFHEASERFQCAVAANTPEEVDAALGDVYSSWVYVRFVPAEADVIKVNRGGKRMFASGAVVALDIDGARAACRAGADMVLTWHPSTLGMTIDSPL